VFIVFLLHSAIAENIASPWTSYFGSQDGEKPWARTVRGVGRGKTGIAVLNVDRSFNMEQGSEFALLEEDVKKLIDTHDVIVPIGGLDGARDQKTVDRFMEMMKRDGGKLWKEVVYRQAVHFAKVPKSSQRLYWQVGNEINSKHYTEAMHNWMRTSAPVKRNFDDNFVLPLYVEYYFAPTIEALQKASRDAFGAEGRIQIVLGTIAGAFRLSSRQWLDDLLSYKIRGDFAESLTNKRVSDLVDVIAIHYLVTHDDDAWMSVLEELRKKWFGRGRVHGIWATEELGRWQANRGKGAATALKVAARYLHWWGAHSMTPREGRCNFWGWWIGSPGTTGSEGIQTMYDFLGETPLRELDQILTPSPPEGLESYAFQPGTDQAKRMLIVFPRVPNTTAALRYLTMEPAGWEGDLKVVMHIFSSRGHTVVPVSAKREQHSYIIEFPKDFALKDQAVAMLFLSLESRKP
jgi:hypothetical protein